MTSAVDFSQLVPIEQLSGDSSEETELLRELASDSRKYLESFTWSGRVGRGWFGLGVGRVFGVFLFEIEPSRHDIDRLLWVIVGDLPPAYLVVDESPTARAALANYVGLMQEWIDAVRSGSPLDDCIPVNAPANEEYADLLQRRLSFLKEHILSDREAAVEIWFPVEKDSDGHPNQDWEQLYAWPIDGGYQLNNIPFFVRDLALNDVVAASKKEHLLIFDHVVSRSGHSTFRILLYEEKLRTAAEVMQKVRELGGQAEVTLDRLVAIDAPPDNESVIWAYLKVGQTRGDWGLQVGFSPRD